VIVDELAFLTSYELDPQLRKRASSALSLLLSQGRGPAVTVIGAMQDPRKDIVAFRDLFPVRVGLRMVEAEQTDMVLGKGARNRGAACELIHEELRGVGYQLLDGQAHPTRVRAAWISDDDIDAVARDYRTAHGSAVGHEAVVIDLRDKAPDQKDRQP